jgi:alpha/beta hydrolase fold
MIRVLIVMLGLLLARHSVEAAPWALPAGIKTLEANGYPMAFLESGTGESIVLVHGAGTDYRSWARQVESPPRGFRLIAVSLRHYYPERWDGKGDTFSIRQHAEDLAAFIEALGVGPVYLVGHSRGGSGCEGSSGTTCTHQEVGIDGRRLRCVAAGVSFRRGRSPGQRGSKSRQSAF